MNLIGREPEGIVPFSEAESVKREIIEKLIKLKDPISGELFIQGVYKKEEIFTGKALNKIPDLIVVPHKGFYLFSGTTEKQLFCEASPLSLGNHLSEGILAAFGKSANEINLQSPRIIDMVPTILNIFGLKIPSHVDGSPLVSRIKELTSAIDKA